jgi:hypothetical protein
VQLGLVALMLYCSSVLAVAEQVSYPRTVKLPGGTVTIHHPSVSDWQDFEVLSAWVPVEISPTGNSDTWTGSVKVQGITDIRYEERIVQLSGLRPVKAVADDSLPEAEQSLKDFPGAYDLLKDAMKQARQTVSLEYLLRALPEDFADSLVKPTHELNNEPPDVIISEKPAILILFDGPPRSAAIRNSELEIVVNTNWTVFHHKVSDRWYMIFGEYWLQNSSLSGGTWEVASSLPVDFENLSQGNGWEGMAKLLPPKQTDRLPPPFKLSYEPAELVLFDGPPQMQELAGTTLQFVANADHDLFQLDGRYYLLLAGRWFSTNDLKRRWNSVADLPDAFAQIPADSEKAHVLSMVPGTEESRIAIIEAAMPRSQSVAKNAGDGLQVSYSGVPHFVNISGTPLYRADNTDKQVLRHNDYYYLCQDAAWYSSPSATGPWHPALEIPQEIYDIPRGDPAYNVTFVKIGSFDNNTGRQAYIHTYGYSGTYTADKGLRKSDGPQTSGDFYDPTYDPRARGWGYWGAYGYGGYGYGGYGYAGYGGYYPRYGYGARYYPNRGAWGYGGYYDPFWGYPYPSSTSVTIDVPDSAELVTGEDGMQRPHNTSPETNYVGSGTYQLDGQQSAVNDPTAAGHLYSGPDGKLYRIADQGWEVQQGIKWVALTEPLPGSVEREYQARLAGYASYQRYQQDQAANP